MQMSKGKKRGLKGYFRELAPPSFDKVLNVITVIGFILTVLSFLGIDASLFQETGILAFVINVIKLRWKVLLLIWGIMTICILFVMVFKYRNSVIIKMGAASSEFSYIIKRTIDAINSIENIDILEEKEIESKDCRECAIKKNIYRELLNTIFIQYTKSFLNKLSDVLSDFVSYEVSTCIKLVVDDEKVVTFVRNNSSMERYASEGVSKPALIEDNTDFLHILKGDEKGSSSYFYVSDLLKYDKDIKKASDGQYSYKNSSENWREYYIGTIVVPIGVVSTGNTGKKCSVYGFLCVDSTSPKAFTKSQKTINIKLLKGYADVYSIVLKTYQKKIAEYGKKESK